MTEQTALLRSLDGFATAAVLCVGDVMLDRYVYGAVERISPEAPIPVLHVGRQSAMLGGAGNVIRNLATLGANAQLVAAVGEDAAGREVAALLDAEPRVRAELLRDASRTTTVKTRFIAGSQQLLRADAEDAVALPEVVRMALRQRACAAVPAAGAVVLSDYGKGVLTDDVLAAVLTAAQAAKCPIVVDPKGDDYSCYAGATVLTPNRRELQRATRLPVDDDDAIAAAANRVLTACGVGAVLVTRGAEGMTLVREGQEPLQLPAVALEVYDVSGAGDTVVATLALGLAVGLDLADAAQLANLAAGIVVAKIGTGAVLSDELRAVLRGDGSGGSGKILSRPALLERIDHWRARGLRIGFANGCFDLVHPGHVSLLEQARAACDRLVVAINSDQSVRRLKGPTRPVQDEAARARVLSSLETVAAVVTFSEDTPAELVAAVRPDVLVKGKDYQLDQVVGADLVQSYGGRVLLARIERGFSTAATVARIAR